MKVLVTGATGFLGGAVARQLQLLGYDVLATGRQQKTGAALRQAGLRFEAAELSDAARVLELCQGQTSVVHCAALSSPWGPKQAFISANVTVTQNVVDACMHHGVKRLVHISTPAVYFAQASRLNVAEDAEQLPAHNAYIETKHLAERIVMKAQAKGLATIMLRPRALFGPGDTSIMPRLLSRLQQGRLPIIGDGQNLIDMTYIDNAVAAVVQSLNAADHSFGQVYNISNGEPVRLWDKLHELCDMLAYPQPRRRLSIRQALVVASLLERLYSVLPGKPEPPLTRYTVGLMAHSMTLDISAAKRDLGYAPTVSIDDGLKMFVDWWQQR